MAVKGLPSLMGNSQIPVFATADVTNPFLLHSEVPKGPYGAKSPSKIAISVKYTLVQDDSQLPELMSAIAQADLVGFDTEFVAEDCYRPDLCLLQISTREHVFNVDPKGISDLKPLWGLLVEPSRTIVVHAGREEILFAYRATGQTFSRLFDVQLALGLLGGEFPASYGKLLQRLLGQSLSKGETRTDWRTRPLSTAQLEYAALDVLHLPQLYDSLKQQLVHAGRSEWLQAEVARRQKNLVAAQLLEGWPRISGVQSMHGRQLSVIRELWLWREHRAEQRNLPPRRVLRDDLIVELSRRGSADPKKIAHIRGLHFPGFQKFIPEIAEAIELGLTKPIPASPWVGTMKRPRPPALLQQFLTAAMSYLCRIHGIAPAIVGTSDDVGRLASYWLDPTTTPEPAEDEEESLILLEGWRGELVGKPLFEIFSGKKGMRVQDPLDEMPLSLCDLD